MDKLCSSLSETAPGLRNETLNNAAFKGGQLVEMSVIDRASVERELTAAAQKCGLAEAETRATIKSGIDAGLLKPAQRPFFVDYTKKGGTDTGSWRNIEAYLDWLRLKIVRNEFTNRDELKGYRHYAHLDDDALAEIWDDAHRVDFRVKKPFLRERLQVRALANRCHPPRDQLEALRWDGISRLDKFLPHYFGAADNPYTRAVGRKTFVAGVKRLKQPGSKHDQLMILEGKQGTGKSSALAIMALQREWFTDCVSLTHDSKVMIEQTEGKLIVEVAELAGMRRGEVEQIKANLSRTHDRARGAYGRLAREVARQFIMIGTTNTDKDGNAWYLKDPTGNRRFWPVKTNTIKLEELRRDMLQLWAEAVYLEAQGESLVLPQELWSIAEGEQQERIQREPWIDELSKVLGSQEGRIAVTEARRIISRNLSTWGEVHDRRLGLAMRELGWRRKQLRNEEGRQEYFYVRGNTKRRLVVNIDPDGRASVYAENVNPMLEDPEQPEA